MSLGFGLMLCSLIRAQGVTLSLDNATATFSQTSPDQHLVSWAIGAGIPDQGWGIHPMEGSYQAAVFQSATDFGNPGGTTLSFTLHHNYPGHELGRFRLSITTDNRGSYADGLPTGGNVTANWVVLTPQSYTSANGTTLSLLPDNSILASGFHPDTDVYTVTSVTSLTGITGIRLEVLPDASLPNNGPGRFFNGNFALTDFQAAVSAVPAPSLVVSAPTTTAVLPIAAGQAATLSELASGGTPPFTYSWYQGNTGDTSNLVSTNGSAFTTPTLTNTTPYWVRVSDSGGQTSDSSALSITVIPVGFSLGSVVDCPGTTITVPFTATGFKGIGSFQGSIHWDPTVVTFLGLTASALTSFGPSNVYLEPDGSTLTVVWEDDSNPAGTTVPDGSTLFDLSFQIIGFLGSSTSIVITNAPTDIEVTDAQGDVLDAIFTSGQVVAGGQVNLGGSIFYFSGSNMPVANVEVDISGDTTNSTFTGADGSFSFSIPKCPAPSFTLSPTLEADAPLTGGVTMLDVAVARAHILGQSKLTSPFSLLAADVNGSQTITAADLRLISLFILNLTNFPAENGKLWRFVPADYVFPNPTSPWSAPGFLSYTGLETNLLGQDFIAVKLGDVNGSWPSVTGPNVIVAGSNSREGATSRRSAISLANLGNSIPGAIQLSATDSLANPGDTVQVAVQISQAEQLTTAQFTVRWNPSVLEFIGTEGYTLRGLGGDNFGSSRVVKGQLYFGWDDPGLTGVPVTSGQRLFWVKFKVVGNPGQGSWVEVQDGATPIELSVGRKVAPTSTRAGVVGIRAAAPGSLGVLAYENQQLDLWYEAPAGSVWEVQASPDLTHWTQAVPASPTPPSEVGIASLPISTNSHRYYRAVRVN